MHTQYSAKAQNTLATSSNEFQETVSIPSRTIVIHGKQTHVRNTEQYDIGWSGTCTQNCKLGTARADFQAEGTIGKSMPRGFQRHVICKDLTLPRFSAISASLGSGGAAGGEPERLVDETM